LKQLRGPGFILILLFSFFAKAQIPNYLEADLSGVSARLLSKSCFAFDRVASGLPCNPAHTAKENKDQNYGSVLWSNHLGFSQEASEIIGGKAKEDTIRSLFNRSESSELESQVEIGILRPTAAIAIIPYQIKYFSMFANAALPETYIAVSQEHVIKGQLASYWADEIYAGLQIRGTQRKWLETQFFLTDVLAEGREEFLQVQTQNEIYFEPGILYSPDRTELNPELSLAVKNWGFQSNNPNAFSRSMAIHGSAAINPRFLNSQFGLGANLEWSQQIQSLDEALTLGGYYRFGILKVLTHFSKSSNAIGFMVNHRALTASLSFNSSRFESRFGRRLNQDRIYTEIGFEL